MASLKLNIAQIRGCPPAAELAEAIEEFGLPETEEFGVLNCSAAPTMVYGTLVRKSQQTVQRLDQEMKEVTASAVEKATVYPFGINPTNKIIEVYAGSATGIEQVGAFLSSHLALPVVIDVIELDMMSMIDRLLQQTEKFQLRAARVTDYTHNSFMNGTYAPKFLDTDHGKDFLEEYADHIKSASVKFAGPSGRITATLAPNACFGYSCNEDDQQHAQAQLRKLL